MKYEESHTAHEPTVHYVPFQFLWLNTVASFQAHPAVSGDHFEMKIKGLKVDAIFSEN